MREEGEFTQSAQRKSTEGAEIRIKSGELEALDRKSPPFAKDAKDGAPSSSSGLHWDLEFGNMGQEGLVRGRGFVMIWRFLVSRGYSAASCSATQQDCCARIHSAFPRL